METRTEENTVSSRPKKPGKASLNKIKKLAEKRGFELIATNTGKRYISFTYKKGEQVITRYYPSVLQGIKRELIINA